MASVKEILNVTQIEEKSVETDEGTKVTYRLVLSAGEGDVKVSISRPDAFLGFAIGEVVELLVNNPQTKLE